VGLQRTLILEVERERTPSPYSTCLKFGTLHHSDLRASFTDACMQVHALCILYRMAWHVLDTPPHDSWSCGAGGPFCQTRTAAASGIWQDAPLHPFAQ
jgi:hypothetical protein